MAVRVSRGAVCRLGTMTNYPAWIPERYLPDVRWQVESSAKLSGAESLLSLDDTMRKINAACSPLPPALVQIEAFARINEPLQRFLAENERQLNEINRWRDQWTSQFGPGTLFGDLFAAREGDVEASWRLAGRLMKQWKPKEEANRILTEQAIDQGSTRARQKQATLQRAVIHVTQYATKEVSVQVGRATIRNEDGTVWTVTPEDTPLDWYWRWVQNEVPRAAEAELLGKPYPASHERPRDAFRFAKCLDEESECADDTAINVLEEQIDAIAKIQEILAQATDKQRALCEALRSVGSIAEAERLIGVNEGSGRQALFRLRKQVGRTA